MSGTRPSDDLDEPSSSTSNSSSTSTGAHIPELWGSGVAGTRTSSLVPDSLPLVASNADWREFRARLVAQEQGTEATQWAHSIAKPETGALLLAHPMMFTNSQRYFYQSVVLLLNHNETGSFGVILNRPSQQLIGQLALTRKLPEFDDCRLYVGGDVGDGTLQLVHTFEGFKESVEVVKGIYMGGIEAAKAKVAAGEAKPDDFRWFARYAGWGPGQLESECKSGIWFTAAASPNLVMQLPQDSHGRDYWHKVLNLMGGNHRLLSDRIKRAEAEAQIKYGKDQADNQ